MQRANNQKHTSHGNQNKVPSGYNENQSRMANHVIPEEPTRENDPESNYNNSLERMGQNIGKLSDSKQDKFRSF